jgi:hypothetical protein
MGKKEKELATLMQNRAYTGEGEGRGGRGTEGRGGGWWGGGGRKEKGGESTLSSGRHLSVSTVAPASHNKRVHSSTKDTLPMTTVFCLYNTRSFIGSGSSA